jgi:hypothetical protein
VEAAPKEEEAIDDQARAVIIDRATVTAAAAAKRPSPTSAGTVTALAKKQAVEEQNNVVTGVVTQAVRLDSKSVERVAVVVTMPGNITNKSQISVDFVTGSNGAKIHVFVPRGKLSNHMSRLTKGIAGMPGLDRMDATHLTHALCEKLRDRRETIDELIIDPIGITLEKACDPKKKPLISVVKFPDGDTVAVILLEVPSRNDYGKCEKGNGDAVMLAEEEDDY